MLRRHKTQGSLSVPDAILYYQACHLARVLDWCRYAELKQWVDIELQASSVYLASLPWCGDKVPWVIIAHPTIGATWLVCKRVFHLEHVSPDQLPLLPVIGHPAFPVGDMDPVFRRLFKSAKFRARHNIQQSNWIDYRRLKLLPYLADLGFWRGMQLTHFLQSLPDASLFDRPLTDFEEECVRTGPTRHAISRLYATLFTDGSTALTPFWWKWDNDLGCEFTEAEKATILQHIHKSSCCTRIQESGFKLLAHKVSYTILLSKMYPNNSDRC